MKNKYLLWIIFVPLVLILACIGSIYVYSEFFYYDHSTNPFTSFQPEEGFFLIDPNAILDSLNNGDMNVFSSTLKQEKEILDVKSDETFNWTPRDYLMITDALNQQVWKDALNDWKIYSMDFSKDCQDNPSGFDEGHIDYFKAVSDETRQESYMVRMFSIMPKYGYINWGGGASGPRPPFGWKSVDLDHELDAVDILRIAEENGGKDIRLKFNNDCKITLYWLPSGYDGWRIWYDVDGLAQFYIMIDPFTGRVIKSINLETDS